MAARTAKVQRKSGPDSFDAFFHPERVAASSATTDGAVSTPAPILKPAMAPSLLPSSLTATPAPPSSSVAGGKLDVNAASSAELLAIPGIGPVLAQRIVDGRPYQSADDLINVKGIGPKIYERIRQHFR